MLPFFVRAGRLQARAGFAVLANPVPQDIILSSSSAAYNASSGAVIGVLSVTDPGESSWSFAITNGNAKFALSTSSGSSVQLLRGLSGTLTTGTPETVEITVTDGGGGQRVESFSISVVDPAAPMFSRQMIGTGAPANTVHFFAQPFGPGVVPSGQSIVLRRGSNNDPLPTQVDVKTTWGDGSIKWALIAVTPPTLSANATENLDFTLGTPGGSDINMATALSGRSAEIRITPSGGSTWTLNLISSLGADRWRQGPLVAESRIFATIPSGNFGGSTGGEVWADLAITADGRLYVDTWVMNARANFPDTGVVAVTFALEVWIDGVQMLNKTATNLAAGAGTVLQRVGRSVGGTAVDADPIFLRPNNASMRTAGLCGHYKSDLITNTAPMIATIDAFRAGGSWGALSPNSRTPLRDLVEAGPTGGDNRGLYGIPFSSWGAAWMSSGPTKAWTMAVEVAEGMGAAGMFPYDKLNERWVNGNDRPGFRTHPSNGSFVPAVNAQATSFMDDGAHHPLVMNFPLLLSGRRLILDCLHGFCHYKALSAFAQATDGKHRIWADPYDQQIRSIPYSMTEFCTALFCTPSGYPRLSSGWMAGSLDVNLQYLIDRQDAYYAPTFGELAGIIWTAPAPETAGDVYFSHWMYAITISAIALAEQQGYAKATTLLTKLLPFAAGRWSWTGTRYPAPLAMAYQQLVFATTGGSPITTRDAFITKLNSTWPAITVGGTDQNHVRINRAMLANLASARPNDATIQAACTVFDGIGWPGLTTADFVDDSKIKLAVFRPPGYAVPDP